MCSVTVLTAEACEAHLCMHFPALSQFLYCNAFRWTSCVHVEWQCQCLHCLHSFMLCNPVCGDDPKAKMSDLSACCVNVCDAYDANKPFLQYVLLHMQVGQNYIHQYISLQSTNA